MADVCFCFRNRVRTAAVHADTAATGYRKESPGGPLTPIGPLRVACAPRPPTAAVSLDRTSMRPNPPHSQVTTDELLGVVFG